MSEPVAPWIGFRAVFAVINGLIWATLGFVISTAVSFGVVANGPLSQGTAVGMVAVACFYVGVFGLPGAVGGAIDQARSGRFYMPPGRSTAPAGLSRWAWAVGAMLGVLWAVLGASAAMLWAGSPSRLGLTVGLALTTGICGAAQGALISGGPVLGDLGLEGPPRPPTWRWLAWRVGLPQAVTNGVLAALIGWVTAGPAPQWLPDAPIDAAVGAWVIGGFAVFGSGGLVASDRAAGRVSDAPYWPRLTARIGAWLGAGLVSAVLATLLALALGGIPLPVLLAYKLVAAFVVAGALATLGARAALAPR